MILRRLALLLFRRVGLVFGVFGGEVVIDVVLNEEGGWSHRLDELFDVPLVSTDSLGPLHRKFSLPTRHNGFLEDFNRELLVLMFQIILLNDVFDWLARGNVNCRRVGTSIVDHDSLLRATGY